jgi:phosphatidylglycerol:prolipoprotein diacylglycerol transferase
MVLSVVHPGSNAEETVSFVPRTIPLHPTQIYESISMAFLFALLLAYYPFRRRPGEVMVLFMAGYAVHRFLNEVLRVDTEPVAFNMTLSQNVSVLVLAGAVVLALILWRKPAQSRPPTGSMRPGSPSGQPARAARAAGQPVP